MRTGNLRRHAIDLDTKKRHPSQSAVLGDVVDVANLLQKSAFTLLTVHLVFLCCARWHIRKTESEANLMDDFPADITLV